MSFDPFIVFILTVLGLYKFGLIVSVIINLLISFDILNRFNPIVNKIAYSLDRMYEPIFVKIRKIIPPLGSVDLSPLILFLIIDLIRNIIVYYI